VAAAIIPQTQSLPLIPSSTATATLSQQQQQQQPPQVTTPIASKKNQFNGDSINMAAINQNTVQQNQGMTFG
jgi:hypothetical protein